MGRREKSWAALSCGPEATSAEEASCYHPGTWHDEFCPKDVWKMISTPNLANLGFCEYH